MITNANGDLVVICVCAGLGVRRRAIASARSSFSRLLVQCHELELFLDEHAVAGFLAPRVGASHRTEACLHRSWCRNMPQIVRGLVSRFRLRRLFLRLSSLAPLAVDMNMPLALWRWVFERSLGQCTYTYSSEALCVVNRSIGALWPQG